MVPARGWGQREPTDCMGQKGLCGKTGMFHVMIMDSGGDHITMHS